MIILTERARLIGNKKNIYIWWSFTYFIVKNENIVVNQINMSTHEILSDKTICKGMEINKENIFFLYP